MSPPLSLALLLPVDWLLGPILGRDSQAVLLARTSEAPQ